MITISFLSVVKNEEKYIAELIRSILAFDNRLFSYEIVIIDDHSDDNTYQIIKLLFHLLLFSYPKENLII